jgi:hypothetical protein
MVQGAQASARQAHTARQPAQTTSSSSTSTTASQTTGSQTATAARGAPPVNLKASMGQILAGTVGSASSPATAQSSTPSAPGQAQQLLNYLLAP